ncbi:hypothetical protein D9M70_488040 [compost metagenome]
MYQAEALWINFSSGNGFGGQEGYPFAVKVAAGKINAITGKAWSNALSEESQEHLVIPDQPWLDGFCVQKDLVRQFVAMPLGLGYTAEEQLSGAAEHGGIQIIVYPMKRERYEALLKEREKFQRLMREGRVACSMRRMSSDEVGLAPGGLIRQQIYPDRYGVDAWDTDTSSRCFVHILNSAQWEAATGTMAPGRAPTAADYTIAGLPWFECYDDSIVAVAGSPELAGLDSVAAKGVKVGETPLPKNEAISQLNIISLKPNSAKVSDGSW